MINMPCDRRFVVEKREWGRKRRRASTTMRKTETVV